MNYKTLLKLKKNPFRKLSDKQEQEIKALQPVKHKTAVKKHKTKLPEEKE